MAHESRDPDSIQLPYITLHSWDGVFSPDRKTIASWSWQKDTIQLWDTVTGQKKKTLTGHRRYVQHLLFTENGQTLISTSGDQTVLVWDLMEQ